VIWRIDVHDEVVDVMNRYINVSTRQLPQATSIEGFEEA
jgi:hypothetical protein